MLVQLHWWIRGNRRDEYHSSRLEHSADNVWTSPCFARPGVSAPDDILATGSRVNPQGRQRIDLHRVRSKDSTVNALVTRERHGGAGGVCDEKHLAGKERPRAGWGDRSGKQRTDAIEGFVQ